jgi:hypothetical protein
MAIQIAREDIELKDRKELQRRILKRVEEYNNSRNEGRGELLAEIQILTGRIETLSAQKTERRALFLEFIVIILIAIEVYQGSNESRAMEAVRASAEKTITVLQRIEKVLPK